MKIQCYAFGKLLKGFYLKMMREKERKVERKDGRGDEKERHGVNKRETEASEGENLKHYAKVTIWLSRCLYWTPFKVSLPLSACVLQFFILFNGL